MPAATGRADAIARLMAEVIDRRARGEFLPDSEVIAAHQELMPELAGELEALRAINRAFLAAERGGRIPESLPADPEAPLASHALGGDAEPLSRRPAIRGYAIIQEISAGGQGTVFKALQETTRRQVAIKVIPGGPWVSSRHRARFEREVAILAALDHPRIVGILDRGRTADGSLYMVMDYIDGWALDEYLSHLQAQGGVDRDRLLSLFIQIAQAVEEAHRRGILHRDLKPSNLRIDRRGEAHVLDFGLARLLGSPLADDSWMHTVTLTGQIVGSVPWASPEQVAGRSEAIGVQSDVYALGVMLYQALTGQFPYPVHGPMAEVIGNIAKVRPPAPSQMPSSLPWPIPPALDAIVLKALAKSPAQRQASAGVLARELEACRTGPLLTPPRSAFGFLSRRALALAALGGMLCIGTVLEYRRTSQRVPQAVFALHTLANPAGMTLVRVPPHAFWMGSPISEAGRSQLETLHQVRLTRPFYIATTEVTQGQYRAVMGQLPCPQTWPGGDLPVHGVLWSEAVEFCKRLGAQEGRTYRLPTEAEWEAACRAGTMTPYAHRDPLESMGWYRGNSDGQLHPVAGKTPNAWGLHDMHGNVREWCADAYQAAYPVDPVVDPLGQGDAAFRVVRGGSIMEGLGACRSAARNACGAELRANDVGFRVVREADASHP